MPFSGGIPGAGQSPETVALHSGWRVQLTRWVSNSRCIFCDFLNVYAEPFCWDICVQGEVVSSFSEAHFLTHERSDYMSNQLAYTYP